ncbi:hypothetical protein OG474_13485 [Kribbella sp. NBC_01505]|uniref:hypothetical protein n=1 Tax=Kribbella sp. NBC_01505 TaxID=2903580 RepID=UPI003870ACB8
MIDVLGRRRARFVTVLSSDLPGAVFTATFVARWHRPAAPADEPNAVSIRAALRERAEEVAVGYAVDRPDAAADAIRLRVEHKPLAVASGASVEVEISVSLSVDAQSARLRQQRREAERRQATQIADIRDELESLRQQVLNGGSAARLWLLMRFPELAGRHDFVDLLVETLDDQQAEGHAVEDSATALTEFTAWLINEARPGERGLDLLDNFLEYCEAPEVSKMLHVLAARTSPPG